MQRNRRSIFVIALSVASLTVTLAVSGCSTATSSSFESQIQERAATGTAFELPSNAGGVSWDELLVLCPYDVQPEGVQASLATAASRIDTNSTDASQWLLFATDGDVRTLILDRSTIDFCSDSRHEQGVFLPEARWTATREDGVIILSTEK